MADLRHRSFWESVMTTKSKGAEFWSGHVEAARLSGVTLLKYAREQGLSVHTMGHWRRKLNVEPQGLAAVAKTEVRRAAFVALKVASPVMAHSNEVTLTIGSDMRLQMTELPPPAWLAEVSQAMRGAR